MDNGNRIGHHAAEGPRLLDVCVAYVRRSVSLDAKWKTIASPTGVITNSDIKLLSVGVPVMTPCLDFVPPSVAIIR